MNELNGLHLDVDKLRKGNSKKSGDDIKRNGKLIVGPDVLPSKEELKETSQRIKGKYGLN